MKIVIVGGGKVGAVLAGLLSQEDHDIVIIDTNQRVLEQLSNLYDVMAVTGNGATMRIQEDAGVKGADLLVAVTSDDLTNMLGGKKNRRQTNHGPHSQPGICRPTSPHAGGAGPEHGSQPRAGSRFGNRPDAHLPFRPPAGFFFSGARGAD